MLILVMVMLVSMPCLVDMSYCWYGGKLCDTLMMMLISYSCILSWLSIFAFKLTRLNWTWTIVGWVMVPLNRCWPVQPRLPVWDGPNWVYCRASRRCLQWGKVMGAHYPDQVGGHKPCVPVVVVMCTCPCLGPFIVLGHEVVVEVSGGRHEATHDLAQWGVSRSGRESVMAVDRFCRNVVGPPEW